MKLNRLRFRAGYTICKVLFYRRALSLHNYIAIIFCRCLYTGTRVGFLVELINSMVNIICFPAVAFRRCLYTGARVGCPVELINSMSTQLVKLPMFYRCLYTGTLMGTRRRRAQWGT